MSLETKIRTLRQYRQELADNDKKIAAGEDPAGMLSRGRAHLVGEIQRQEADVWREYNDSPKGWPCRSGGGKVHVVIEGQAKALCTYRPGYSSPDWQPVDEPVTCPKCKDRWADITPDPISDVTAKQQAAAMASSAVEDVPCGPDGVSLVEWLNWLADTPASLETAQNQLTGNISSCDPAQPQQLDLVEYIEAVENEQNTQEIEHQPQEHHAADDPAPGATDGTWCLDRFLELEDLDSVPGRSAQIPLDSVSVWGAKFKHASGQVWVWLTMDGHGDDDINVFLGQYPSRDQAINHIRSWLLSAEAWVACGIDMPAKTAKNQDVCKSCDARITWLKTEAGASMPVDGWIRIEGGHWSPSMGSHWASCPYAETHKKKAQKQGRGCLHLGSTGR